MMATASLQGVEEAFAAQQPHFALRVREMQASPELADFTDRWVRDPRPWARDQIIAYLQQPLSENGQSIVVKRLFRHAEATRDDDLMGWFLPAFDRLIRYERQRRRQCDPATRQSVAVDVLELPRRQTTRGDAVNRSFSFHTRSYLRRRAWRYFRQLGFQRSHDYVPAMARALIRYTDEDLTPGEHLLESWGLAHACFGDHPALLRTATRFKLRAGHALAELDPAPCFPDLWEAAAALDPLLELIAGASSRLVRVWGLQLVQQAHAHRLPDANVNRVLSLLHHADDDVQQFGAKVFCGLKDLPELPLSIWLQALETGNPAAEKLVHEALQTRLRGDRLSLDECIRLACAPALIVSRKGIELLRTRSTALPQDAAALSRAADSRCDATAGELARWVFSQIDRAGRHDREFVLRFFEASLPEVRGAAWEWLTRPDCPAATDPQLWTRLLETPHDDLQRLLIDLLRQRTTLPDIGPRELAPLWRRALLNAQCGSRRQLNVIEQVREALLRHPADVETLLPILVSAARSSRGPQMRAGLAAVATILVHKPEWQERLAVLLPELQLL